jgi:hypothetical protein
MHRDMMKNGCKSAVFSIAMHYFFHPDAIFFHPDAQLFSSRRIIIPIVSHYLSFPPVII